MNVGELREILANLDSTVPVFVYDDKGCQYLELRNAYVGVGDDDGDERVRRVTLHPET